MPTQKVLSQSEPMAQGEPSARSVQRPMLAAPAVAQCELLQSPFFVQADPSAPSVHFPPPYVEL
jgi:hypothetical protein